jgi:hypothetical protein
VHGHAEKEVGHAQQRVQHQQNEARHNEPVHGEMVPALGLCQSLLLLNLGGGDRKADVRQFVVARARSRRKLSKTRRGDGDADAVEAPTQSSRLPPSQRPIMRRDVV